MSGFRIPVAFGFAVLAAVATVSVAQQTPAAGQAERLVEEVAGLNRNLDRLVLLMEQAMDYQRVDLLIKRIELGERRMLPVAEDLRSARREVEDVETDIKRYDEMLEHHEATLRDEIRRGVDAPDSPTRQMLDELRRVAEVEGARLDHVRDRVHRLEDELAEGRKELIILDEQLRALLQ